MKECGKIVNKRLNRRQKDIIFVSCLVALPLFQYFIFYICVNFNSLIMAFQKYRMDIGAYQWIGLDNFERLWTEFVTDGLLLSCIRNSFLYYCINTVVGTTLGLVFSFYIFKKRKIGNLFKVMLFLPSIISSIVMITLFNYFADFAVPKVLSRIMGTSVEGLISSRATAFGTVVFYNIWAGFGPGILLYTGAMANISEAVMEAAKIDGAGSVTEFLKIVIPSIFPTLSTFIITGVAGLFIADMGLFSFFGTAAERYLWTFGYYLLRGQRMASLAEYPYLSAIGVSLTFVAVPLTFLVRHLLTKYGPSGE